MIYICIKFAGRYAEEFIEKRRQLLERWMNRVSRHPVIALTEVFQHFITCDSEAREKVITFIHSSVLFWIITLC